MVEQITKGRSSIFGGYFVAYLLGILTVIGFQVFVPDWKKVKVQKDQLIEKILPLKEDGNSVTFEFINELKNQEVVIPFNTSTPTVIVEFLLQVGSFRTINQADTMMKDLSDSGFVVFTEASETKSGLWYRVRIGPFYKKTKVSSVKNRIMELGIRPIIIERKIPTSPP